jgi:hypothetical protein
VSSRYQIPYTIRMPGRMLGVEPVMAESNGSSCTDRRSEQEE